jgi:hypothetical protein
LTSPRLEQYFVNRPALTRPYQALIDTLGRGSCRAVALQLGSDSWEYPLWVLGRPVGLHFDPVIGGRIPPDDCALASIDMPPDWRPAGWPSGQPPVWRDGPVVLWRSGS